MSTFDDNMLLNIEGGLTNDPDDRGGLTKFGISKRSYPDLDITNLTREQASAIYLRDFWNRNKLGSINSQDVANQMLILSVNIGQETAVRILQTALVRRGMKIEIDGVSGSVTLSAVNMCNPFSLTESIRVAECKYYLNIVDKNKTQEKFFKGWIRRALI